ncbi:MAG: acetyl-CoA carboxylase carboxyltransferase subunit alpha [Endomicrobium sp.]|jgi:acetyl-CoA carboxylase carboxyl transferase subunit alpha|nr:acetyl-CoA carboxylase carboxyltransferase subunit alpha [Endomicrobium sp.]
MITYLDFEKPIIEIENKIIELKKTSKICNMDLSKQINMLERKKHKLKLKIYSSLTPWQKVKIARHQNRPHLHDYINLLFNDFIELHGDRCFGDDCSMLCGLALINKTRIVVIGQQKGKNLNENIKLNFGMAHPEGYRKALRIMELAEKFNKPIVTFIDTPGAYAGIAAEERGQAQAIAKNLIAMSNFKVPIISIIIGEGGSGGALGIGISNKVLCLEYSYYSVISPEGCAAILFRDINKSLEAAKILKIVSKDLLELNIIDEIIKEPLGGAHNNIKNMATTIKLALIKYLKMYKNKDSEENIAERYKRFRKFGIYKQ